MSMRTIFTSSVRSPAFAAAGSIVLAVCLSSCASSVSLTQNTAAPSAASPSTTQGVQTTKESRFLGFLSPYRIDIQQGNFISSETMNQLQEGVKRPEGMTRDQVKFLLGTPLITDIFHVDRWDYVFLLHKGNGEILSSHVAVLFDGNKLSKVDGSTDLPTEKDYISLIANNNVVK